MLTGVCKTCKYWEKVSSTDHQCFNPKRIPRDRETGAPLSPLFTGEYYGCDEWKPVPKEVV